MPQLEVPLFKQPESSGECGQACLAMIFAYYKGEKSYDDIRKELPLEWFEYTQGEGLVLPAMGRYLQQNGFQTTIVLANPRLFCAKDLGALPAKVKEIIDTKAAQTKKPDELQTIVAFQNYVEAGGIIKVAIPSIGTVKDEIDAGHPFIFVGTTRFLHNEERTMNFHFTVGTGYDETNIYVNDPAPYTVGHCKHPQDWWFYCLYASSYGDLDNSALLCIRPK